MSNDAPQDQLNSGDQNLAILNWFLVTFGSTGEKRLVKVLCAAQVAGGVLA